MRYGIMAMQLDQLIPSQLAPQEILAHIAGFDHAGLVRRIASHGFDLIELGGDLSVFLPQAYEPRAIDNLASLKAELGLSFTVHLPLWSVEPSTPLEPVRRGSVAALIHVINATLPLEPEIYVLHATGALAAEFYRMRLPETARRLLLSQFQNAARASLSALLAETGIPARRLAVETIEFPFEATLAIADDLDLSICLDTGHVLAGFSGPIGIFEALDRCFPRLGELHLHDAPWQGPEQRINYGLDHQALGKGDLDVAGLLDRLEAARFKGPVIFELTIPEALASLDAIHLISAGGQP